jgi:hypothetical protein
MKIRLIISGSMLVAANFASAQNNAIFYGGSSSGYTSAPYTQSTPNNARGGEGQGYVAAQYVQLGNQTLYHGGQGQGYTLAAYIQAGNDNLFLGGPSTGYSAAGYAQASVDKLFNGGDGAGWSLDSFAQASIDARFIGGGGDGWVSQTIILPLNPLAVEYLSFTGEQELEQDLLTWETASENNTSHFIVEHSTNGSEFFELGMRDAAGSSTATNYYSFTNKKPATGNNFYRLKLKHLDGTISYSNVILLQRQVAESNIAVFPNPTADLVTVTISGGTSSKNTNVHIYNVNGAIMHSTVILNSAGSTQIDLSNWPPGIYTLHFSRPGFSHMLRVQKR